ncbi:proline dehydrogenase 2, mitochondrial-like [Salvia miltiorrhiza]|uniref:proline dehydrogenase 2, mitochondrial-like n=1 Tax=Salvia miltiorrhiza TaxID=226208 RepID=UPI0025ABDA4D|nr:proline dehydrogenase 2, mitochondrial-like [Salvia miltiorrhiza]XP_057768530.1 proline dehydrogenase 2, mitochondrial-like [Salvia miltiorrhiza]
MATRSSTNIPKLIAKLPHYCRRLKSSAAASLASSGQPVNVPKPEESPYINLDDSKKLFSSVPTAKLMVSTFTLHVVMNELMIDIGSKVMNSRLMKSPVLRELLLRSIEHTLYHHFCGGKTLREADQAARKLWESGLQAMLDYGMEHAHDNASCNQNVQEIIETIASTISLPSSPVSSVVVKITAIFPPRLLKRVSDLLRWEYKDKSLHLPWKLQSFPLLSDSSALYHTPEMPGALTLDEERDLELGFGRLMKICESSLEANVPLLIDAEDTTIQPAIDYFTYHAAINYHKGDSPLIFNTMQAYLKDAKERLVMAKKAADEVGVPVGFKLVRGAYMSTERQVASSVGANSPIHDCIQDTHACYDTCASFMLQEIANGSGSLILATHNIHSGKLAAAKVASLGMKKDNEKLHFAQLYGMADVLSFGLRNAGFNVSKYLPYGAVEHIVPYLLRRAEENRGFVSTAALDRQLMRRELLRRLTSLEK